MSYLARPDGAKLYWEEHGEGALVVLSLQFFAVRETWESLIAEHAREWRIVYYEPRGIGRSSRRGPYDFDTDVEDLGALIEEVSGGPAIAIAIGDGCNRAVKLAARRPDLIDAVVSPGGNPVGRRATQGTDALAGSDSVLEVLVGMMATDYRGGLRTVIANANSQLDAEGVRKRVATTAQHVTQEAALARLEAWIADSSVEEAKALGDRLWLLPQPGNPWFPIEIAKRTRAILPEAQVEIVEDGPVSRPDITARVVRELMRTRSTGRVQRRPAGRA